MRRMRWMLYFHWTTIIIVLLFLWNQPGVLAFNNDESDDGECDTSNTSDTTNNRLCAVIMAKSSIWEAGWGVFAGQDFQIGDRIGTPSIAIPFLDFPTMNTEDETQIFGSLSEYLWDSKDIGGFMEGYRVDMFLPGPASFVNHHAGLENVLPGGVHHDDRFHRQSNPMAGSSTSYTDFYLIAKRNITQGEELFIDRTRNTHFAHKAYTTRFPSIQDYTLIDEMVQEIYQQGLYSSLTQTAFHDVLHRFATEIIYAGYGDDRSTILTDLFPRSQREFERCLSEGSAKYRLIHRNIETLQSQGYCLDSITNKPSTLPYAGQGAFTTRSFREGESVSVSPMIAIPNGPQAMTIPNIDHVSAEDTVNAHSIQPNNTEQLLMNYCFGHEKSDLLLCPTTQAVAMNHQGDQTNVAVRWAVNNEVPERDQLILQPLNSITSIFQDDVLSYQSQIVMEYVALRDIQEGEELFLDYSSQWQEKASIHFDTHYNHPNDSNDPTHMQKMHLLEDKERSMMAPTEAKDLGFTFLCDIFLDMKMDASSMEWELFSSHIASDMAAGPESFISSYMENDFMFLHPCEVLDPEATVLYSVEIMSKPLLLAYIERKFLQFPRSRLRYHSALYSSDMHLSWAFRHSLYIPDTLFPMQWRNDYVSAEDIRLGKVYDNSIDLVDGDLYENSLREAKCGLYLAPSNIPGAGLGVYTGVDISSPGTIVSTMLPVIPAFTYEGMNPWMGKDYVWSSTEIHAASLEGWPHYETNILSFLFGALANAHAGINNIYHVQGDWIPMIDSCKTYGAGAFTDYAQSSFRTLHPIRAGEELFVSYGEHWFQGRSQFDSVPLEENFRRANYIVASIWALLGAEIQAGDEAIVAVFLRTIQKAFVDKNDLRTIAIIKRLQSWNDILKIFEQNGVAETTVEDRGDGWLEKNGFCLDHIFVQKSTLPNAGYGAFSRRFLKKGALVTTSPVVVTNRSIFDMDMPQNVVEQKQLLLNYHFGHPHSSALFFPLVTSAFVNHASTRMEVESEPNAKIALSTNDRKSMYFEALTLDDLFEQTYSTIMIDLIAIRDIAVDEEIFIDYGQNWENAWLEYVSDWTSPCDSSHKALHSSKQVLKMNEDKFNEEFHIWSCSHVSICHYNESLIDQFGELFYLYENSTSNFDQVLDPFIRLEYKDIAYDHEGFDIPWYTLTKLEFQGVPCKILGSARESNEFDVVYLLGALENDNDSIHRVVWHVRDIPSSHVRFEMRPFASDMMGSAAFRHEIEFPNDAFPHLWKDLVA